MSRIPFPAPWRLAGAALLVAQALLAAGPARAEPPAGLARQVLAAVNDYRSALQLPPLQPDPALEGLAAEHSRAMAQQARLSHAGFQARFQRAHRHLCVENLATGYRRAEALLDGWRASPKHHENLLEPRVLRVGVAQVDGWVTLLACTVAVGDELVAAGE